MSDPTTNPRPVECCGACPEIFGGGYDCTCKGNPRCLGPDATRKMTIDEFTEVKVQGVWNRSHHPKPTEEVADV